jgi:3-phenylpropionate/trans-cinnamate dioxygenase ferredoxin subunit
VSSFDIGTLDDYLDGGARQVKVGGRTLVVVRIEDDVYALDDRCSHEEFSLAEGEVDVESAEIECARHGAMFRLCDGEPTSLPATRPVGHYPVSVINDHLEVLLP